MKVKDLIKELRKYNPELEVVTRDHDNAIWEMQSWINSVAHICKSDITQTLGIEESQMLESLPEEWIAIGA